MGQKLDGAVGKAARLIKSALKSLGLELDDLLIIEFGGTRVCDLG